MRILLAILLFIAAAPAMAQDSRDVRVTRINLVWHEQEPADVPRTCVSFYGKVLRWAEGCYRMVEDECHIYTAVVRSHHHFKTAGHELFHCHSGLFHGDSEEAWLINPLPLPPERQAP